MSRKLREQVWRHPNMDDPSLKLTLLALAELADDTGMVSPAHAEVAEMAAIEVETVSAYVKILERYGYLTVVQRVRGRGCRNTYRLHLQTGQVIDRRARKTPSTNGGFIAAQEEKPLPEKGVSQPGFYEKNPGHQRGFSEQKPPLEKGVFQPGFSENPGHQQGFYQENPGSQQGFLDEANKDTREIGLKSIENTLLSEDDDEEERDSSSSSQGSAFSQAAKYQPIYDAICKVCGFEDVQSISRNNLTEISNTLQWLMTNVPGTPEQVAEKIIGYFSMPPSGPWDKSNPPWPSQIRFDWVRMKMKVASAAASGNSTLGGKNGSNSRNSRGLSGISAFDDGVRSTRRAGNREPSAGATSE
jgi:hypothetical protein